MKKRFRKKLNAANKDSKQTLLLIDSSNLIYAASFAFSHLSYNGMETGVIYGFLQKVLFLANKFKTNKFIFCWDAGSNYRDIYYPEYKSKRKEKVEERTEEEKQERKSMFKQSDELQLKILPELGFKNSFCQSWYEADDLLAFWANKLKDKYRIIMVSADADMYQCLDNCDIWNLSKKRLITSKILMEEWGIPANKWGMAKAIGGCDGDGVIGIKGVSDPKKKTSKALKYLSGKLKVGKIKDRIESKKGQKIIAKNLPIVTLPYMEKQLEPMIYRRNKYSRKNFIKVFDNLKFYSFLDKKKMKEWENIFCNGKEAVIEKPKRKPKRNENDLRTFF